VRGLVVPDDVPSVDQSLSLQFAYSGLDITLIDQQVVDVASPESEDTGPLGGEPGFWYELRDAAGAVLWRHEAVHPIWFESEGPADDGEAMTWGPDDAQSGSFTAQVPVIDGAVTLALVGSPPPGSDPGPVQDLATFDLGGFA
jgi:hypothetical protein